MVLWLRTMPIWSAQQYNFADNPTVLGPLRLLQPRANLVAFETIWTFREPH
ncbi:hypothetical protein [Bradyrhizobium sp.]|uniref:hypothetical protein n=1 Tax=Bradyrhizobium sp. TaxID=376 RepID=UPI001ED3FCDF|nr:hypothetical protein [Bradyrhizobium sp.]MBV9985291.1 hypothetical protein [Bradyrhizobium sp.]